MITAMRVAGNKEGDGECGKSDGNGDKGVWQGTVMATKRATATAMRVAGDKEGNDNKEGNNSNKGSGQQRGPWQGQQRWWQLRQGVMPMEITFMDTEDKYKNMVSKFTKIHIFKSI